MTPARCGFALLLALAGVIVLAGLAALANVAAVAAIRESAALRDEAQAEASREALRARVERTLAHTPRGALVSQPVPLGGGDTALVVTPLGWPWHRLAVLVDGEPVVAELGRATIPELPWCTSVVVGGASTVAQDALSIAASSACSSLVVATSPATIASFDGALGSALFLGLAIDALSVSAEGGAPEVWRANRVIEIAAGASVSGLVIAPVVRIAPGAIVRGLVIAAESLVVAIGGNVIADERAVRDALAGRARLRSMGRRGFLIPP